ncbi:hypothetical protein LXL04_006870 [Taraxacum kok-saghyz]
MTTHFNIYSWFIILIVSGHGILGTNGRILKSMEKQEVDHNKVSVSIVGEKKVEFPPHAAGQSQEYGRSTPESVTDFRPTTPGNSPGAGHSFVEHSAPAVPESGSGSSDDFRPTGPGHSPGGGHSKDGHIATPNA